MNMMLYIQTLYFQLAGKMNLLHVSEGQDKERHIVIKKPGHGRDTSNSIQRTQSVNQQSKSDLPVDTEAEQVNEGGEILNSSEPIKTDKLQCPHCNKDVITANYALHELNCLRNQRTKSAGAAVNNAQSQNKENRQSSKKKNRQSVTSKLEKIDSDDFDALIAAATKIDDNCAFKKCKVKVRTLGQNCEYCGHRFCLSHHIPEIHGCGDVAKAQVRATHIKEGVLYRSSMTAPPPQDPAKKAQLQKRLDKKINDMTSKRSTKEKKSKNQ